MKRESLKGDISIIKGVLIALITSREFIEKFKELCNPEWLVFKNKQTNTIVKWCLDYYEEYQSAPNHNLQALYDKSLRTGSLDSKTLEYIEVLLVELQNAHTSVSEPLCIDFLINGYLKLENIKSAEKHVEMLLNAIEQENVEEIKKLQNIVIIEEHHDDEQNAEREITNKDDIAIITKNIHDRRVEPLFMLSGGLGYLLNDYMCRNNLIALLAPEKRGKSFWLMEFAMRACIARNNVAVFEVGDLSESQYETRVATWMTGIPFREKDVKTYTIPVLDCMLNQKNDCSKPCRKWVGERGVLDADGKLLSEDDRPIDYRPCDVCFRRGTNPPGAYWYDDYVVERKLEREDTEKAFKRLAWRMKGKKFRLSFSPNSTVSVNDIDKKIAKWKKEENWIPDVIVIDYADILAPEDNRKQSRDQHDERWRMLRRLSQKYNALVLTATQGSKETNKRHSMDATHVSEDKRKNAHLTGLLGINETEKEKKDGIQRLSWLLLREGDHSKSTQAVVLQNRNVGIVHEDSYIVDFSES